MNLLFAADQKHGVPTIKYHESEVFQYVVRIATLQEILHLLQEVNFSSCFVQ